MVRDILIELYLFFFRIQFNLFKLLPLKNKVTFVVSFGENSLSVFREMKKQGRQERVVFLRKSPSAFPFKQLNGATVINFETINLFDMIRSIYHLATSKYIVIDNYYGFLATANFKDEVKVIQLWHAVGAIKSFGLNDLTINKRSKIAKKRFGLVYQKFQKIVVGSEEMARIFIDAFNVSPEVILRTGIPRTDIFYDEDAISQIKKKLYDQNELLQKKKVILYAPTYRDDDIVRFELKLDIEKLFDAFGDSHVLVLKLHPVIKNNVKNYESLFEGFVFDYSSYTNVNDLLLVTDILITDYSSIYYEFSLLSRPIIFFSYDEESYKQKRGMIGDYNKQVPGPIAKTTDEVIAYMKHYPFNLEKINSFAKKWNRYSRGNASLQLIHYMFDQSASEEQQQIL